MVRATYPVGLLFSLTGSYETAGRTMLNGALLACRETGAIGSELVLEPHIIDPACDLAAYVPGAEVLLSRGIRHVVGCYTSSSRKEVIPVFEKRDALLWYPSHYEGFESSDNVIYTGASPNHHILPLIDYVVPTFGRRTYCVGSNYIWAWELNRILRENLAQLGGAIVAERYFAIGDTDFSQALDAILEARPDFIFNTLIGESAYAFFRALRQACLDRGIDQPTSLPVVGCNLSEPELKEIGREAVDGHVSSSVYFSSIPSAENRTFVAAYRRAFPEGPEPSTEAEGAYIAVSLLAQALRRAGTDEVSAVKNAVIEISMNAPQGLVSIDPETFHAFLTPRIGVSRPDGEFDLLVEAKVPLRPDPYLVRSSASIEAARVPSLRVVS